MSTNALNRNTRGVASFRNMKNDLEKDPDRLLTSLPLFVRTMFIDANPWIKEINRYDFILMAIVHSNFGNFTQKFSGFQICEMITSDKGEQRTINLTQFLSQTILLSKDTKVTIKEFCLAVGYNGGIHMVSTIEKYRKVYDEFIEIHPSISINIIKQIAKTFVQVFDQQFEAIGQRPFAFSYGTLAPTLFSSGKRLPGLFFQNSFLQHGIKGKVKNGIRLCFDLQLVNPDLSNGAIFTMNHNERHGILSFWLTQEKNYLVFRICYSNHTEYLRIQTKPKYFNTFQKLELCIYPDGNVIVAENEILKTSARLKSRISLSDCKLVIGANQHIDKFGTFYHKTLIVQTVDSKGVLKRLITTGLEAINGHDFKLPYNILKRPFLV